MATITLRSVKGSPLTNNEVDANFTNLNTDKYESGSNVSAGNLTYTGTLTAGLSASVAAAGNDQSGATALTKTMNIVTSATATSADGVKLPDTAAGLMIEILNDTSVSYQQRRNRAKALLYLGMIFWDNNINHQLSKNFLINKLN